MKLPRRTNGAINFSRLIRKELDADPFLPPGLKARIVWRARGLRVRKTEK